MSTFKQLERDGIDRTDALWVLGAIDQLHAWRVMPLASKSLKMSGTAMWDQLDAEYRPDEETVMAVISHDQLEIPAQYHDIVHLLVCMFRDETKRPLLQSLGNLVQGYRKFGETYYREEFRK